MAVVKKRDHMEIWELRPAGIAANAFLAEIVAAILVLKIAIKLDEKEKSKNIIFIIEYDF